MDSSSRRFPFSVSGSRSSFTTPSSLSSSSSSSSLSSSRQYGRDRLLGSSGCYPRASSTLKPELEHQSSRYLSSARASSSSSSRSPSWKLPSSLSSSSTSYERPWADSKLGSRDKLGDSTRLGSYTGLLKADDGDSKRAKLTYGSRGEYSKASSTSIPGSLYSSSRFSSGADATDSTRSLCRLRQTSSSLSSSSSSFSPKPVLSRGELETRPDPGLASLGEGRLRSSALTYQPDRYSSTYAQGARPKETPHSSTSSFTRESSLSRHHLSSSSSSSSYHSSAARDLNSRVAGRTLSGSSLLHPSHPTPLGSPEPTSAAASPSASSVSYFYSFSSRARREPSPPSAPTPPAPEAPAGPEGRLSTRRLLSRLFSRRSSQDSSSSSSSSSSSARPQAAAESPPPTSVAVASDPEEVDEPPVPRDLDSALDFLRRRRLVHSRNQETQIAGTQSSMDARRASTGGTRTSTSISTGGASSWLSSSLRNHCTPLFSRQQRDGAAEKSPEESEDEEPEEEDAGAGAGAGAPGPPGPGVFRVQQTQGLLQDDGFIFSAHPRVTVYENILVHVDEAESRPAKSVPDPARDPERLRKIQESLLLEESDEEEGDLCRICQMGDESPSNPLIEPCRCTGSLQYVHQECIKKWLCSKISSGTNLEAITSCELCKQKLHLNIDNFDVSALYRTHVQSEYEFISSGLYLVVLLHLCEQRFSDVLGAASEAGFFNLARTLDQHMDIIESGRGGLAVVNHHHHDDDDEEDEATTHDTRPLIDFSDLDDIEEED